MMEGDRNLNHALQKPLLRPVALPPNVFPDLVRVKKMALVEEPDSPPISLNIHAQILAARSCQPGRLSPCHPTNIPRIRLYAVAANILSWALRAKRSATSPKATYPALNPIITSTTSGR